MKIGNKNFMIGEKTYIMGILNVTDDSFSDGGSHSGLSAALSWAEKMIKDGADIIDVGGESTRPGYVPVEEEEEIRRIVPVIRKIKSEFDIPVSVDTSKYAVAEAAFQAGADMLNDIRGLKKDPRLAELCTHYGAAVCIMHNRENPPENHIVKTVLEDLKESLCIAKKAGIAKDRIILDPGIGFAKSYEQNLEVLRNLAEIKTLGFPLLLGASRKSVIGTALDLPVDEREEGTMALSVYGALQGCDFVRVHDVEKNARALKMTDILIRKNRE